MVQPLPPTVLTVWRIGATLSGLALCLTLGAAEVVVRRLSEFNPPVPPLLLPVTIGIAVGGLGWVIANRRFNSWGFTLTDEWMQAQWGVFIRRTATIPRNRVQIMTSSNGPIDRLMGLTSVQIHTAGVFAPNITIPHLEDATVHWLREELARGTID